MPVARWVTALALSIAALLALTRALRADGTSPRVAVHIRVEGVINPIEARYVHQALEAARDGGAAFVLMSINTPGGLVSSMEDIVGDMTNSPVPVIGFVEPPTAQATSAGAFLLLATDVAAMAPGTRVGAAHPVGAGKNLEGAMEEKATNSLVSLAKSLATRHGRPESYAESIVRKSESFTAEEAKKAGAVELVEPTVGSLLEALDGFKIAGERKVELSTKGVALVEHPMSWTNRLLDVISDPTLASIFFTLGVLGILYELSAPGIGLAGILGTIFLLLALLALSTLPLKLGGFALLLAGFVGIAVEVKSPTHGALALGGVVALVLGALVLVDETGYFGGAQKLNFRIFVPFIAVVAGSFVFFAGIAAKALRAPARSGVEMLSGSHGFARSRIGPDGGMVFVDGTRWQAMSDAPIESGEEVVVEEVVPNPTRLKVKPAQKGS